MVETLLAAMPVEVGHDDVFGDVAGGGGEAAPAPEPLAPVAIADVLELLPDLARRAPLGPAHEVTDRDIRGDFDEHMGVIAQQGAVDDCHAHFVANALYDLAYPQPNFANQHGKGCRD